MSTRNITDNRAVAYLRISDPYAQTRETSRSITVDQPEAIKELEQRHHLTVVATFSDKQTGKNNRRPGFRDMQQFIVAEGIHHLICFHSDRLTRTERIVERAELVDFLHQHQVTVYGTDGVTTPDQALMNFIKFSMSAEDNAKRRERVRRSHQTRMKEGVYRSGSAPMGYKRQSVNDPNTGRRTGTKYIAIEAEVSLIRRIFREFLAGESLWSIAHRLNAEGVPTKRMGAAWYGATIKCLLANPIYAGVMREEKTGILYPADNVEPLIDWDTAEAARKILAEIGSRRPGTNARDSVFSGLLECEHCGAPLYRVASRDKRRPPQPDGSVHVDYYWRCSRRLNGGHCQAPSIREDKLLALLRPGLPLIFGKEMWERRRQAGGAVAGELRVELDALKTRQRILTEERMGGELHGDVFRELNEPIKARMAQVEELLDEMADIPEALDAVEIASVIGDRAKLKLWLRRCIRKLTIRDGKLIGADLVDEQWNDVVPMLEEWDIEVFEVDPATGNLVSFRVWVDDDEDDGGIAGESTLGDLISVEVDEEGHPISFVAILDEPDDDGLDDPPGAAAVNGRGPSGPAAKARKRPIRERPVVLNSPVRSSSRPGSPSRS